MYEVWKLVYWCSLKNFPVVKGDLSTLPTCKKYAWRFQDSLTTKRRQLQEKLAEKVVSGAKYHQDQQGNIIANDESSILPTPTTAGASSSGVC